MSRRKITMLTDALMGSAGAQNATRQVGVLVAPDSVDYVPLFVETDPHRKGQSAVDASVR